MVGDTDLCNVVMDTDEHDRMSMLCIACEMVSMVAMVTNEQYTIGSLRICGDVIEAWC